MDKEVKSGPTYTAKRDLVFRITTPDGSALVKIGRENCNIVARLKGPKKVRFTLVSVDRKPAKRKTT